MLPTKSAMEILNGYRDREYFFSGKLMMWNIGRDTGQGFYPYYGLYPITVHYWWVEEDEDNTKYTEKQNQRYSDARKWAFEAITNFPYYINPNVDPRDIISLGYNKGHPHFDRKVKNAKELDALLNEEVFTQNKGNLPDKYVVIYDVSKVSGAFQNYIEKLFFENRFERDVLCIIGATSHSALPYKIQHVSKGIYMQGWDRDILGNLLDEIAKQENLNVTAAMKETILNLSDASIYGFFKVVQTVYDTQMAERAK